MISRQPIYEGTNMGDSSLEYIISGAALKCQSRKDYEGCAVEYALLFWTLIYTIRAGFMKLLQKSNKDVILRSSSLWKNVSLENTSRCVEQEHIRI